MVKRGKQTVPVVTQEQRQREGDAAVAHAADHGEISSTTEAELQGSKRGSQARGS
jgi:hypothetical protein